MRNVVISLVVSAGCRIMLDHGAGLCSSQMMGVAETAAKCSKVM